MAEFSLFHTTGTSGDGASPYTSAQVIAWLRRTFLQDHANQAVLKGYGDELAVTGNNGTNPSVDIGTGAAYVYGHPYENDATKNIPFTRPTIGTTGYRVVLRLDPVARTVRATLLSSNDGVSAIPAATQVPGGTWDVTLATFTCTTGGVITITDTRGYAHPNLSIGTSQLDDAAVSASKLASGAAAANIGNGGVSSALLANGAVTQAKLGSDTLRQLRIPIVTSTCAPASSSAMTEVTDLNFGFRNSRTLINRDRLPAGATVRLVVLVHANLGSARLLAELYNATTGAAVAGSSIDTGVLPMNVPTVVASGSFAATALAAGANQYVLRVQRDIGQEGSGVVHKAELIVEW